MERPSDASRAHVERPDIAGCGIGFFGQAHGHDEQIVEQSTRRVGDHEFVLRVFAQSGVEVCCAIFAEGGNGLAGQSVQCIQFGANGMENAPVAFTVGPVGHAPSGAGPRFQWIAKAPDFFSGCSIQREGLHGGRNAVQHAVYNDRVGLDLAGIGHLIHPCHLQLLHILRGDLGQAGVVVAVGAAQVFRPAAVVVCLYRGVGGTAFSKKNQ